jgi:hypothetical protein
MTKVQTKLRLARSLDDTTMGKIADAHSIYGISRVQLDRDLEKLTVEYDATRLNHAEVQAALARAGIAAVPEAR